MDWELHERYQATVVLVIVAFICSLLLAFQQSWPIQRLRSILILSTLPLDRLLNPTINSEAQISPAVPTSTGQVAPSIPTEQLRALQLLEQENEHLHQLLDLQQHNWPQAIAAHVMGRDPQRWFGEIVLDKGSADRIAIDDPVIAVDASREGLIGRVVHLESHLAKVMLVQDSLSAIPAMANGQESDDGVVEGTDGPELYLRFLSRSSKVKIGDLVVSSGLGGGVPPGIPIGWIEQIEPDTRQLFLQARIRPAVSASRLRTVLILRQPLDDSSKS